MMTKYIRVFALLLGLAGGQQAFAGIPVIDGVSNAARLAEFTQTVAQWSKEISEMQQQYQMLSNQYSQLQKTYSSANGARDWANAASNTYDKASSWEGKMSSIDYSKYKEAAKVMGVDEASFASDSEAATAMTNAQNTNAFNQALNEENFTRVKKRQDSLEALKAQINTATDEKDIADLHARITSEQTMLQNEQNAMLATAQLQQGQRDIQAQQASERLMKMGKLVNIKMTE
jgi:type IV secretion system protein VirB5